MVKESEGLGLSKELKAEAEGPDFDNVAQEPYRNAEKRSEPKSENSKPVKGKKQSGSGYSKDYPYGRGFTAELGRKIPEEALDDINDRINGGVKSPKK